MTSFQALALVVSSFTAGALNSVAGGGSFLSFPVMVMGGLTPLVANATNSVALWPASLASAVVYRRELLRVERGRLRLFSLVSLLGGVVGAVALVRTPNDLFVKFLPWLLLFAALLFSFGAKITGVFKSRTSHGPSVFVLAPVQFLVALYGGYFGGGMGIMMLAIMTILGMNNVHEMNALKTVLATLINLVAVITFIAAKQIDWSFAVIAAVSAIAGGTLGAKLARKLKAIWIRAFVLIVAWGMTILFFSRAAGF